MVAAPAAATAMHSPSDIQTDPFALVRCGAFAYTLSTHMRAGEKKTF